MPVAEAKRAPAISRDAIIAAFHPWVKGDVMKALYEKIQDNKPAVTLIEDALEQVIELRVASYDHWWQMNHWRYNHLREIDRRSARECVRAFVAEIQLGRIKISV